MKLHTFFLVLFAMFAVFGFLIWQRLSIDIEEELRNHAISLNSEVPIDLNPHTDMIGARADGKEIVYLFRVHGLSVEAMERNKDVLRANKIQLARNDKNITRLLESGARLTYEYFVGDELALRFSIEKEGA